MKSYKKLEKIFAAVSTLGEISNILGWDSETMMPNGAAESRGRQLAYLNKLCHSKIFNKRVQDLLEDASSDKGRLDAWQKANLKGMQRQFNQFAAVPQKLLSKSIILANKTTMKWRICKQENNFNSLKPVLSELLSVVRDIASLKGDFFQTSPYQALVDEFDEGRELNDIDKIFSKLSDFLPSFIKQVVAKQPSPTKLIGNFSVLKQKKLSLEIMKRFGFDFNHGRLDLSTHPFCGGNKNDLRITTRYDKSNFISGLFGTIHETGHSLYEANLPNQWSTQPVGENLGMAIHESQSLLAEMQIGLSKEFIEFLHPLIIKHFEVDQHKFSVKNICNHLWHVTPSFIRVKADEVTYPLHVILRYQLEKDLISGKLEIKDLSEAWNSKFKEFFGIIPDSDANGCFQDIHWQWGTFGYFPSYTLGAITAAQFMHKIKQDLPEINNEIRVGKLNNIYNWLKTNIYSKGQLLSTQKLMEQTTGEPLNVDYFIQHLKQRYG